MLAFCGHNEDMSSFEGNLNQLLLFQAQDFPEMSSSFHTGEYLSPEVNNEMVQIMGQSVLWILLANINTAPWFLILASESTEIIY